MPKKHKNTTGIPDFVIDSLARALLPAIQEFFSINGLYEYFHTDVKGKGVMDKMKTMDKTDNKLILVPKFTCWDEGVRIGEVSP